MGTDLGGPVSHFLGIMEEIKGEEKNEGTVRAMDSPQA